ncbi:MAG: sigma-70 factor domain-containing protein, partial [Planctomycetota bacterium]
MPRKPRRKAHPVKNGKVDETSRRMTAAQDVDHDELSGDDSAGESAAIDDPVRMYLMQMGEIPMLDRVSEITAAQQIEETRQVFRRTMLCSDFVLHAAVELLQRVADGSLRLDRTIEISVTNTAEKKRVMKRIGPNLTTARQLLEQNRADFLIAASRRRPAAIKRQAWRRLINRRNKVVRLVEELNLRIQRLLPIMEQLHEIANRMQSLREQLSDVERLAFRGNELELREELKYLMRITQESPGTLQRLVDRTVRRKAAYDA